MRGLLFGNKKLGMAVDHKGFNLLWKARDARGFERAKLAVDGGISLLRALHHGGRGLVRLAFAWLPRGTKNPMLNALAQRQDDIIKYLDAASGDGKFKAKVKADARSFTVMVDAHGKRLSDVIPIGGLPLAMMPAYFSLMVEAPRPSEGVSARQPVAPLTKPKTQPGKTQPGK
jgi:hypothetical protein